MDPVQKLFKSMIIFACLSMGGFLLHADGFKDGEDSATAEQAASCSETEHYCSHTVAMFSEGGASIPPYKEGECAPKTKSCSEFWCGPRHCGSGLFGAKSVCCVNNMPGQSVEYKCAYSELSCPGNTMQLSIRASNPAS
jgi:hypothetical protein